MTVLIMIRIVSFGVSVKEHGDDLGEEMKELLWDEKQQLSPEKMER